MKVLVAYPIELFSRGDVAQGANMIYSPDLATANEAGLQRVITEKKPDVLVVGSNKVGKETLEAWRSVKAKDAPLYIIRRGTSLEKIDTDAAKKLNINVENTPGINAPFVARWVWGEARVGSYSSRSQVEVAVIGSGNIGKRIILLFSSLGYRVRVYSPSLGNYETRERAIKEKGLTRAGKDVSFESSAEEAVRKAKYVVIAVGAQNMSGPKLDVSFVNAINSGAHVISISENKVFEKSGLDQLLVRAANGLALSIDTTPNDVREIVDLTSYSKNGKIKLTSVAMHSPACKGAMDQAVEILLARLSMRKLYDSIAQNLFEANPTIRKKVVSVVGAGIIGLMTAYLLSLEGYKVKVYDSHPKPGNPDDLPEYMGSTTLDGGDARHATGSETSPHARPGQRERAMVYPPSLGGWQLRESPHGWEGEWIDRWNYIVSSPELCGAMTFFVTEINLCGVLIWQNMLKKFPELKEGVLVTEDVIRIFRTDEELQAGFEFQKSIHSSNRMDVRMITQEEVRSRFKFTTDNIKIAGGVVVPGFIINFRSFYQNLLNKLEQNSRVRIRWSKRVEAISSNSDGKKVLEFGNDEVVKAGRVVLATGYGSVGFGKQPVRDGMVQGVMGCWLMLENTAELITEGFKIHEEDPVGVINVSLSADKKKILFSGGFGFVGQGEPDMDSKRTKDLFAKVEEAAEKYLPMQYLFTKKHVPGGIKTAYCIRPMTPDGMPIVNVDSNHQEYFISGTNSGGFVEAPMLAAMVVDDMKRVDDAGKNGSVENPSYAMRALSSKRSSLTMIQ